MDKWIAVNEHGKGWVCTKFSADGKVVDTLAISTLDRQIAERRAHALNVADAGINLEEIVNHYKVAEKYYVCSTAFGDDKLKIATDMGVTLNYFKSVADTVDGEKNIRPMNDNKLQEPITMPFVEVVEWHNGEIGLYGYCVNLNGVTMARYSFREWGPETLQAAHNMKDKLIVALYDKEYTPQEVG